MPLKVFTFLFMLISIPEHLLGDDRVHFPGDGLVGEHTRHIHDPTIIHAGDRYFCFSTSGNGFGMLKTSDDLKHWKPIGPILPETPKWLTDLIPAHRSLWAPDILRKENGALRMYYSASEKFGSNTSYIGVAECERFDPQKPTAGWRDLGLVIASRAGKDNFNAIDPETVRDDTGREWMFFGSYWSGLYVVELDPKTGKLLDPEKPNLILVARNPADPANGLEAPAVIFHDGYYYLFNSYGLAAQGVKSTYRIGAGRSKSITGPYVDRSGKPMVDGGHTILLRGSPPMYGPGHCDVIADIAGRTLLAHHFYDGREPWGRDRYGLPTLHVRELLWDTDGWPLPGQPVGLKSIPQDSVASEWTHQIDFGEPTTLTFNPGGTFTGGAWKVDAGTIQLTWTDGRVETFILRDNTYYVGRDAQGRLVRGARKETPP